ncbi:MAG TPA: serine hydrolase [Burkholderiales bacterium]|nr:serine hydrolase [Burkholderiales bacterium]
MKALLALAAFLPFAVAQAAVEDPFPRVAEAYLVKRAGVVIWAGHADARLAPASLTKMMTALVALESGRLDEIVTVSRAASRETGSRIGLKAGQQLRVRDLLAAMVVRSANDACRAIADHFGVTFVPRMNQRALALELRDTQFVDPCGHDRPGQYSTATDLARLAEHAMAQPEFARLARTERITIATTDRGRKFYLTTTNALLGRYEGAIGVKTGSTGRAGNCLVAIAERKGVRVVLVLLNAHHRWWHAQGMLDRAFESYPGM